MIKMNTDRFFTNYFNIVAFLGFIGIIATLIFLFEALFLNIIIVGTPFIIISIIVGYFLYDSIEFNLLKKICIAAGFINIFVEFMLFGFAGLFIFGVLPLILAYVLAVK